MLMLLENSGAILSDQIISKVWMYALDLKSCPDSVYSCPLR